MTILGIDPGSRRIGYGIIRRDGGEDSFVAGGIFSIRKNDDHAALLETKKEMARLLKKYKPHRVAIEKLFFAKNQKTGIAVAQTRGVLMLTAHEAGVEIQEYTPNEVKLAVTGYGFADKKSVAKMVRLHLKNDGLRLIDDAMDALAIALTAKEGV